MVAGMPMWQMFPAVYIFEIIIAVAVHLRSNPARRFLQFIFPSILARAEKATFGSEAASGEKNPVQWVAESRLALFAKLAIYFEWCLSIFLLVSFCAEPLPQRFRITTILVVLIVAYDLLRREVIPITNQKVDLLVAFCQSVMFFSQATSIPEFVPFQVHCASLRIVLRLTMSMICSRVEFTVTGSLILTTNQTIQYWVAFDTADDYHKPLYMHAMCSELLSGCALIICVLGLEHMLTTLAETHLQMRSVRESLRYRLSSRKLLGVMCDADVWLSSDLKLLEPCPKLVDFLRYQQSPETAFASGLLSFASFVPDVDLARFKEFMHMQAAAALDFPETEAPAAAFEMSLLPSEGDAIAVTLYDVPILDSEEGSCTHLLGILLKDRLVSDSKAAEHDMNAMMSDLYTIPESADSKLEVESLTMKVAEDSYFTVQDVSMSIRQRCDKDSRSAFEYVNEKHWEQFHRCIKEHLLSPVGETRIVKGPMTLRHPFDQEMELVFHEARVTVEQPTSDECPTISLQLQMPSEQPATKLAANRFLLQADEDEQDAMSSSGRSNGDISLENLNCQVEDQQKLQAFLQSMAAEPQAFMELVKRAREASDSDVVSQDVQRPIVIRGSPIIAASVPRSSESTSDDSGSEFDLSQ